MVLLVPSNMCTAAVEHRMICGNGPMLGMSSLAQQLEKATRDSYPPMFKVAAATKTLPQPVFRNWRLRIASRTSDHFCDDERQLGGQDGTDASGHTLKREHRCIFFDRSPVLASNHRGIL